MEQLYKVFRFFAHHAYNNSLRCIFWRLGGVQISSNVWISKNVRLSPDVNISPRVRIGRGVIIGANVILEDSVKIGDFVRLSHAKIGANSHIEYGVIFTGFQKGEIKIGRETYIGIYAVLDWSGGISIGDYVHIAGPSTGIWTHSSVMQALLGNDLNNHHSKIVAPVIIEDYVWIGGNCTIYPGVTIGHHSVVLPNSAVADSIPPGTMVGGIPARRVRTVHITKGEIQFEK